MAKYRPPEQHVRFAAVVVEMADGQRMLYEFDPRLGVSFDLEAEYASIYDADVIDARHRYRTKMTFSGTLRGGRVWEGDMPTGEARTKELEQGSPQLEA